MLALPIMQQKACTTSKKLYNDDRDQDDANDEVYKNKHLTKITLTKLMFKRFHTCPVL